MFSILAKLTGLGGLIANVGLQILDLYVLREKARSNEELAKIDAAIKEAEGRKAILIAESGSRLASAMNASMRLALAVGPASILLKFFLWDKVIGSFAGCGGTLGNAQGCYSFSTDKLTDNEWYVIFAVVAFYFAYDISMRLRKQ